MTTIPDIDLQSALNDRLSDEFPTTAVAWENTGYIDPMDSSIKAPVVGTPYLRAFLLPAESEVMTLGPSPYLERRGIFQIDCVYPTGAGWGLAKAKASSIVAAFPAGISFVYNGLTVLIKKTWPGPGIIEANGWYVVPVSVSYWSYSNL